MPTPTSTRYDAVIVGARCAGAGTALLLARAGLSVLVLDRAPETGDTLSTHGLLRAGVLQLDRWGVLQRIVAAGTPPVRKSTFHYVDHDVAVAIKPLRGLDAFYAPRRSLLDSTLAAAAVDAGAEVLLGARVVDVVRHGDRVSGVQAVAADGRTFVVRAPIVVGADGRSSTIAASVRAPKERVAAASSSVVYGYMSGLPVDGYEWWFRRHRSIGLIPTNDGQHCVFACGPEGVMDGGPAASVLLDALPRVAPELASLLAAAGAVEGVRRFTATRGYMRRPWGPGWALVGDAGYLKDPITAHGMSDALRDAELLARAIVARRDGASDREAFGTYHRVRDELSLPLFRVAGQIGAHAWSDEQIPALLLDLSAAMTDEVAHLLSLDDEACPITGVA